MNWNPSWFLQLLWPLGQEDVRTMYRKRRDLRLRNRVFRAHAPPIITNFDAKLASNQNDRLARKFPVKNHPGTNLSLTRDHFSELWRCKEVNVSFLLQICLKSKSEPLLTLHVSKTTLQVNYKGHVVPEWNNCPSFSVWWDSLLLPQRKSLWLLEEDRRRLLGSTIARIPFLPKNTAHMKNLDHN